MLNKIKKTLQKPLVESILLGISVFIILDFLIFPGLTAPNTIYNILSVIGFGVLSLFIYQYIDFKFKEADSSVNPGETELDYIPKEEIVKKKRTTKKKTK
jgi:hypothetical protein